MAFPLARQSLQTEGSWQVTVGCLAGGVGGCYGSLGDCGLSVREEDITVLKELSCLSLVFGSSHQAACLRAAQPQREALLSGTCASFKSPQPRPERCGGQGLCL